MSAKFTISFIVKVLLLLIAAAAGNQALINSGTPAGAAYMVIVFLLTLVFFLVLSVEKWWELKKTEPAVSESPDSSERIVKAVQEMSQKLQEKIEYLNKTVKDLNLTSARGNDSLHESLDSLPGKLGEVIEQGNTVLMENLTLIPDKITNAIGKNDEILKDSLALVPEKITGAIAAENETLRKEIKLQFESFKDAVGSVGETIGQSNNMVSREIKTGFEDLIRTLTDKIDEINRAIQDKLAEQQDKNISSRIEAIDTLSEKISDSLEILNEKSDKGSSTGHIEALTAAVEKLESFSVRAEEIGTLMHVNQAGFQAGVEMLNTGLSQILEKVESSSTGPEEQQAFMEKLLGTLKSFHEQATEILIENASKTREILTGEQTISKK